MTIFQENLIRWIIFPLCINYFETGYITFWKTFCEIILVILRKIKKKLKSDLWKALLIIGLIEVILFLILGGTYGIVNAICILLSFIFYLPVALFAKNNPKLGMLMIPKTIMYIIIISLGLSLL